MIPRKQQWFATMRIAFICTLMATAAAQTRLAAKDTPAATVFSGTLFGKNASRQEELYTQLDVDAKVYIGHIVGTGRNSKGTLLFRSGNSVDLFSNGRPAIEITSQNGQVSWKPLAGQFLIHVRNEIASGIRAPGGSIHPRKTEIYLDIQDDGTTTVTVLEGSAEFSNQGQTITLDKLERGRATPTTAPKKLEPITLGDAQKIIEWTFDLNNAVIPREKFFTSLDRQAALNRLAGQERQPGAMPKNADARREYGDALFDSGQFKKALTEYEAALTEYKAKDLASQQLSTLTRIGDTLLELGRLDEAECRFNEALGTPCPTAPEDPVALIRPGNNTSAGGAELAQVHLLAAVPPHPDEAGVLHAPALLGLAWVALKREQPEEAETRARKALDQAIKEAAQGR